MAVVWSWARCRCLAQVAPPRKLAHSLLDTATVLPAAVRASRTTVIYRLPPLELDREGRPLGKHRYLASADELEAELLTRVLHTDVASMVNGRTGLLAGMCHGLLQVAGRTVSSPVSLVSYLLYPTPLLQRKALAEALPVLSAALVHLERARQRFNDSGLPAARALPLATPGAAEPQPVDQPAEQVRWLVFLSPTVEVCTCSAEGALMDSWETAWLASFDGACSACPLLSCLPQGPAQLEELPMLSRLRVPHVPAEVLTLYSPNVVQGKPHGPGWLLLCTRWLEGRKGRWLFSCKADGG